MTKTCTKCRIEKYFKDFSKNRSTKDGLCSWCKTCAKESGKAQDNEISAEEKKCTTCSTVKPASGFYRHRRRGDGLTESCRECILKVRKSVSFEVSVNEKSCSTCGEIKCASSFGKDKTKKSGLRSSCRDCNRKHNADTRDIRNQKNLHKLRTNLRYRMAHLLRGRLRIAIAKNYKAGSAVRDLGCSIPQLLARIESLFQPKMTWENYGSGSDCWHLDHIVPLVNFDLTDRQHLLLACHYLNLQPLWETENISKGCRYKAPVI